MSFASELLALNGAQLWQRFSALCQDVATTQEQLLLELLQRNANSHFGEKYAFAALRSSAEFRARVPLHTWDEVAPWINVLVGGENNALTVDQAILRFVRTTGTTGTPKMIPLTEAAQQANAVTMNLRLLSVLQDHPEVLQGDILALANPAVSGHTATGIPYGAASGLALSNPPPALAQRFAYPPALLEISEPASRNYAMLRFAAERNLALAVGNNPHHFSQLFGLLPKYAFAIIDDIRHGKLTTPQALDADLQQRLEAHLRPNPQRAAALEALGALEARQVWPNLRLIVCWKTGLMSRFLDELAAICPPDTIFREYGYGASEGVFTIPLSDKTSAGVLSIHGIFFEFLPENTPFAPDAKTLLAHEVTVGERYQLILTTSAGLYRYCLGDLVEVNALFGTTPQITFLRKVGDVVNMVGEKIDARQVAEAMENAQRLSGVKVRHYQWLTNEGGLFYELCVEPIAHIDEQSARQLLEDYEAQLRALNGVYHGLRNNKLLHAPKLRLMRHGWLEGLLHSGGYQAKPKIVGQQLAAAEYSERLIDALG